MRLCVLSSGSGGNCLYLEAGSARVLIDAGLSAKETARRLDAADLRLQDLTGVLLTHEHADHAGGAAVLARKLGIPVYATRGTHLALRDQPPEELVRFIEPGQAFRLSPPSGRSPAGSASSSKGTSHLVEDGLYATPIGISHDASEPVVYSIEERFPDGACVRTAVVTDCGHAPAELAEALAAHDALVLEMNHDLRRLMDGPYPWSLKQRVRSGRGHLSNAQGAGLLAATHHRGLRHVFLAHLSAENNTPDLARAAAEAVLDRAGSHATCAVASQAEPGAVFDLPPPPPSSRRPRQLALF